MYLGIYVGSPAQADKAPCPTYCCDSVLIRHVCPGYLKHLIQSPLDRLASRLCCRSKHCIHLLSAPLPCLPTCFFHHPASKTFNYSTNFQTHLQPVIAEHRPDINTSHSL
jgi:hypothetical protein